MREVLGIDAGLVDPLLVRDQVQATANGIAGGDAFVAEAVEDPALLGVGRNVTESRFAEAPSPFRPAGSSGRHVLPAPGGRASGVVLSCAVLRVLVAMIATLHRVSHICQTWVWRG